MASIFAKTLTLVFFAQAQLFFIKQDNVLFRQELQKTLAKKTEQCSV